MKNVFALLLVAGTMSFVACGPSSEEKAQMETDATAQMDSLFEAASQSMAESAELVVSDSVATDAAVEEELVEEADAEEVH